MITQLNTDMAGQNINSSIDSLSSIIKSIEDNPQNKDLTQELRSNSLRALMFTGGMRDILNDLSYNESVFNTLIDDLDDGYDIIQSSLNSYKFDNETFNTVEKLLTQIVGLINDLQTLSIEKNHDINLSA